MQVNEVHNAASCKISRIQAGEGVAFHVGSKHTWYAYFKALRVLTHALVLRGDSHLNTSCAKRFHLCASCTLSSMQPQGSASMSLTSKPSMNKSTPITSVRMGHFNFPAKIRPAWHSVFQSSVSIAAWKEGLSQGGSVVCCLSLCMMGEQLRKVLSADKETF